MTIALKLRDFLKICVFALLWTCPQGACEGKKGSAGNRYSSVRLSGSVFGVLTGLYFCNHRIKKASSLFDKTVRKPVNVRLHPKIIPLSPRSTVRQGSFKPGDVMTETSRSVHAPFKPDKRIDKVILTRYIKGQVNDVMNPVRESVP